MLSQKLKHCIYIAYTSTHDATEKNANIFVLNKYVFSHSEHIFMNRWVHMENQIKHKITPIYKIELPWQAMFALTVTIFCCKLLKFLLSWWILWIAEAARPEYSPPGYLSRMRQRRLIWM